MSVSSELTLGVDYYNEAIAFREPLIEPVETEIGHRPWSIAFTVSVSTHALTILQSQSYYGSLTPTNELTTVLG